jgi:hypothetical protein
MYKLNSILFCLALTSQLLLSQTTFTFDDGNGTDNYLTQTTAQWTEAGYTLSFSVSGGGTASPLGQYDGILGSSGYSLTRWTVTNGEPPYIPISITVSISGKVFDLSSLELWDEATEGGASYSILTSKGGTYSYNFPHRTGDEDLYDSHSYSGTNFSGISDFTITFNTGSSSIVGVSIDNLVLNNITVPMPVELTSFTVNVSEDKVLLNWQTATEANNYGFSIERRTKNEEWEEIGFVKGNGNSNSPKEYSFIDNLTFTQDRNLSYRLKQIDNDGKYEYSKVVEVTLNDQPKTFELSQNYPNPFNPTTIISYQLPVSSKVSLKIFNSLGKEIETLVDEYQDAGFHSTRFTINSSLTSGIYFYKLQAEEFVQVKKLILIK